MAFLSSIDVSNEASPVRRLALAGTVATGGLAVVSGVASVGVGSLLLGSVAQVATTGLVYWITVLCAALLSGATAVVGWRERVLQPRLGGLSLLTALLLVVHLAVGIVTARLGLVVVTAVVQFSTALALVGVLLTIALGRSTSADRPVKAGQQRFRRSLVTTGVLFYVVMLVGRLVTSAGATAACGRSFPLCEGALLPANLFSLAGLQQMHRLSVLVVAVLIGSLVWHSVQSRWNHAAVRSLAL